MLSQPPYALASVSFRFRALVSLCGRLPLGGEREVAMALFVGARLADGCVAARPVESAARKLRVVGARHWIGSVTLPAPARSAVLQLFDSSGADDRPGVAAAVEKLAAIATALLDAPSRAEIKQLLAALRTA